MSATDEYTAAINWAEDIVRRYRKANDESDWEDAEAIIAEAAAQGMSAYELEELL